MSESRISGRHRLAEIGQLIADPTRAGMLLALMDGTVRPAGELARMVNVAASTASAHLRRLTEGGLVAVRQQGRHRYFELADERVAHLLETLGLARDGATQLSPARRDPVFVNARTCFDHLAGRLGVSFFECLRVHDDLWLADDAVRLSDGGRERLHRAGLLDGAPRGAEQPGRVCVDWTERRLHLGGRLGAALTTCLFQAQWLSRRGTTRALIVTARGRAGLEGLGIPHAVLRNPRAVDPAGT
jgi:DNA-binding transcriptional ArsR family regulator